MLVAESEDSAAGVSARSVRVLRSVPPRLNFAAATALWCRCGREMLSAFDDSKSRPFHGARSTCIDRAPPLCGEPLRDQLRSSFIVIQYFPTSIRAWVASGIEFACQRARARAAEACSMHHGGADAGSRAVPEPQQPQARCLQRTAGSWFIAVPINTSCGFLQSRAVVFLGRVPEGHTRHPYFDGARARVSSWRRGFRLRASQNLCL